MRKSLKFYFATLGLLISIASTAHATTYTFTPIDYPGPPGPYSGTYANGINDSGDFVGYYGVSSNGYGFLFSGGSFTPINFPGATVTKS